MVAVDDVLRGDTFGFGFDGDWHTVFVAAANEGHFATLETEVAGVDVSRDINPGEMADVDGSVSVWESGGDESPLEVLVFSVHYILYIIM